MPFLVEALYQSAGIQGPAILAVERASKSVEVLSNGIEAVMVLILRIQKASPVYVYIKRNHDAKLGIEQS